MSDDNTGGLLFYVYAIGIDDEIIMIKDVYSSLLNRDYQTYMDHFEVLFIRLLGWNMTEKINLYSIKADKCLITNCDEEFIEAVQMSKIIGNHYCLNDLVNIHFVGFNYPDGDLDVKYPGTDS